MKKSKEFILYAVSLALAFGTYSCKKDDNPVPEIVTNPLDDEVYYLVGKVADDGKGLPDVTVSVSGVDTKSIEDGTFQLKVDKKGDYKVRFEKSGFVTVVSDVTVGSDLEKNASVTLTQDMTATNAPVSVSPDEASLLTEAKKKNVSLAVPAGAVLKNTDISVTEFTEGAKKTLSGEVRSSLATINCEPDGLTFAKPVTMLLKNPGSGAVHFAGIKHYVEKDGEWILDGDADYDISSNAYSCELNGFSNHSVAVTSTMAANGTSSESLASIEADNLGRMSSMEKDITVKQKMGWEIDGDLQNKLKAQFPALNTEDIAALSSTIASSIASQKGSSAGLSEVEVSLGTAKISGDMKMVMDFSSNVTKSDMSFHVVYNGNEEAISVPIKTYAGVSVKTVYQKGNSHTDHSGGAGK